MLLAQIVFSINRPAAVPEARVRAGRSLESGFKLQGTLCSGGLAIARPPSCQQAISFGVARHYHFELPNNTVPKHGVFRLMFHFRNAWLTAT